MLKNQLSFIDGTAQIYSIENVAEAGDMPVEKLFLKATLRFDYRTVGAVRYYTAMQAAVKVDKMIAVPKGIKITPQDVVILCSEDAKMQYRIKQDQIKTDTVPHSALLSLERIDILYDIA